MTDAMQRWFDALTPEARDEAQAHCLTRWLAAKRAEGGPGRRKGDGVPREQPERDAA